MGEYYMLHFSTNGPRLCDALTRRQMLHVGGLGLLGLSLPEMLRARSPHPQPPSQEGRGEHGQRAKSCILLFLMGGPPQHSTWDPKPDAPAEVRGDFGPIVTTVPGLSISELLPRTALVA